MDPAGIYSARVNLATLDVALPVSVVVEEGGGTEFTGGPSSLYHMTLSTNDYGVDLHTWVRTPVYEEIDGYWVITDWNNNYYYGRYISSMGTESFVLQRGENMDWAWTAAEAAGSTATYWFAASEGSQYPGPYGRTVAFSPDGHIVILTMPAETVLESEGGTGVGLMPTMLAGGGPDLPYGPGSPATAWGVSHCAEFATATGDVPQMVTGVYAKEDDLMDLWIFVGSKIVAGPPTMRRYFT